MRIFMEDEEKKGFIRLIQISTDRHHFRFYLIKVLIVLKKRLTISFYDFRVVICIIFSTTWNFKDTPPSQKFIFSQFQAIYFQMFRKYAKGATEMILGILKVKGTFAIFLHVTEDLQCPVHHTKMTVVPIALISSVTDQNCVGLSPDYAYEWVLDRRKQPTVFFLSDVKPYLPTNLPT